MPRKLASVASNSWKRSRKSYPDVKIFLTFGFTLPQAQVDINPTGLPHIEYGLLPALLNGMLDASKGKAKIIDGFEMSYGYKDKAQFDDVPKIRQRSMKLVANRGKYDKHYAFGFGLWMDMNSQKYGWNTKDVGKNYFTPERFEKSVRTALERSDEYVWIYTEAPKWWSPKGKQDLPAEYDVGIAPCKESMIRRALLQPAQELDHAEHDAHEDDDPNGESQRVDENRVHRFMTRCGAHEAHARYERHRVPQPRGAERCKQKHRGANVKGMR